MQIHELPMIVGSSADDDYVLAIDSGEHTYAINPSDLATVAVSADESVITQTDINALFS